MAPQNFLKMILNYKYFGRITLSTYFQKQSANNSHFDRNFMGQTLRSLAKWALLLKIQLNKNIELRGERKQKLVSYFHL